VALVVVAIAYTGFYATYTASLKSISAQQEMVAATLGLEERLDQVRSAGLPVITSASRLRAEVLAQRTKGGATLPRLIEEIDVSAYPPPAAGNATPIQVRRQEDGSVTIVSDPGAALMGAPLVRVDVHLSWNRSGRQMFREVSSLIAMGGVSR
jgi:type II secretory pathway pseudopilin PulG